MILKETTEQTTPTDVQPTTSLYIQEPKPILRGTIVSMVIGMQLGRQPHNDNLDAIVGHALIWERRLNVQPG